MVAQPACALAKLCILLFLQAIALRKGFQEAYGCRRFDPVPAGQPSKRGYVLHGPPSEVDSHQNLRRQHPVSSQSARPHQSTLQPDGKQGKPFPKPN